MSIQNQIDTVLSEALIGEITASLQQVREQLKPYLNALTVEERKYLPKMGDKTLATVQKIQSYAQTNPEFLPSYMNLPEFGNDVKLASQLTPILNVLTQLESDVNDTVMLAGSEAYQASLLYYGQVKQADAKGVASAKPIYDDLKGRFVKRSKKVQEL